MRVWVLTYDYDIADLNDLSIDEGYWVFSSVGKAREFAVGKFAQCKSYPMVEGRDYWIEEADVM